MWNHWILNTRWIRIEGLTIRRIKGFTIRMIEGVTNELTSDEYICFMNYKSAEATALFANGYNCAQAVLSAFGKAHFKDHASALRLASGFGAGIAYRGEMCGAVSGAIMALGLRYGYQEVTDTTSKENMMKIIRKFLDLFEEQHGSVICSKLLNVDIGTPEGLAYARENEIFK